MERAILGGAVTDFLPIQWKDAPGVGLSLASPDMLYKERTPKTNLRGSQSSGYSTKKAALLPLPSLTHSLVNYACCASYLVFFLFAYHCLVSFVISLGLMTNCLYPSRVQASIECATSVILLARPQRRISG